MTQQSVKGILQKLVKDSVEYTAISNQKEYEIDQFGIKVNNIFLQ